MEAEGKTKWLDEARQLASGRNLNFEDKGDCLAFPLGVVREFRKGWIDRDRLDQGILYSRSTEVKTRIYLSDQMISLPGSLLPFPFSDLSEFRDAWADFIKGTIGFEYDAEGERWSRRYDDPGEAVDEIERILSGWAPEFFEILSMMLAVTDFCVDEVRKRAIGKLPEKRGG